MTKVSEKIKTIRSEMQLSQRGLARILYISRGYISDLEKGHRNPSVKVLKRIDKLYNSIPKIQVLTPKQEVKVTLFDRFLNWFLGWRQ